MRNVLVIVLGVLWLNVAAAESPLPALSFPFERLNIQPRSVNTSAPELPVSDSFLWIVSIGFDGENHALGGHFCGGSLIAPSWVVTAAHCVMKTTSAGSTTIDPAKIQVKIGYELDKPYDPDPRRSFYKVEKIVVHDQYKATAFNTLVYDIALLKLLTPISNAAPTNMVKPGYVDYLKEGVIVIGWGQPGARKNYLSNRLRYLKLNRLTLERCNDPNYYPGLVDDKMICALGSNGTDACQGDSGGPLVGLDENRSYYLYGIVSWGDQCGESLKPGIYASIPSLYQWIQTKMSGQ